MSRGGYTSYLPVVLATCFAMVACWRSPSSPEAALSADPETLAKSAWASFRAGDSTRALDGLEQAAQLYATAGKPRKELETWIGTAIVVSEIGAPQRALERLRSVLERARQLGLREVEGSAGIQLARSQTMTGDFAAAHASLDQALFAFEQAGLQTGPARVAEGRCFTLLSEGRVLEAIAIGEQAIEDCDSLGLVPEALRARASVAYGLQQTGDDDRALDLYHDLLQRAWRNDNQRLIQFVYCNLAEIEWRRGQPRPAEDGLRAAIDGLEAARAASPATPEERASFLSLQVPAYDRLIRLLADTYRGPEGFAVAERFHALSLRESLEALPHASTAPDLSRRLGNQESRLLSELGAIRLDLDETLPPSQQARRRAELTRLEAALAALQIERHRRIPQPTPMAAKPPRIEQVQAALEPGEALVAYWVSEERLLAWVVAENESSFVEIPLKRQRLAAAISRYLSLLRSPQRAEDAALKGAETEHMTTGMELYRWLIGSLPPAASEAEVLIVVPDDLLHRLPFESLIHSCQPPRPTGDAPLHGNYRGCRFLGVSTAIAYNPSAGVFLELRQRSRAATSAAGSVLAMAPTFTGDRQGAAAAAFVARGALPRWPLIHAADEVGRVAEIFSSGTGEVGHRATEARFKAEAGRHRYLHLATHGLVDDTLPMVSGLLLEPGDGEDGLLQAYEVLGLRLQSELVTLSACRSGRGELSRGEGVIGLARAFLRAGATSVLVSQWDVDDRSTPELMESFYRRLAAGVSRAEALRAARQDLFERDGETRIAFRRRPVAYAHPRYWSPFVLIGAP